MLRETLHALLWAKRHWAGQLAVAELPWFLGQLRPDDVAIDIGAHAGSWTLPLARALPHGRVYAWEALPYYANVLGKLLRLRGANNVSLLSQAATAHPCEVRLVWKDVAGRRITGLTHIAGAGDCLDDTVAVPGRPLDEVLDSEARRVRLLKCDVEGAEYGVFVGAARVIERWAPIVYSELNEDYCRRYGYTRAAVAAFFARRGYRLHEFAEPDTPVPVSAVERLTRNDALFLPPGLPASWCRTSRLPHTPS